VGLAVKLVGEPDAGNPHVRFDEVRAFFFTNKGALPASTLLQITRLANPSFLIEVDATAILPPRA
jgi:enamine deaminase RidA (YjgF/YER057c/UK114 family)